MINLKSFENIQINDKPFTLLNDGLNGTYTRFYHKLGLKLYKNGFIKDEYLYSYKNKGTLFMIFNNDDFCINELSKKVIECVILRSLFSSINIPKYLISIKCYHIIPNSAFRDLKLLERDYEHDFVKRSVNHLILRYLTIYNLSCILKESGYFWWPISFYVNSFHREYYNIFPHINKLFAYMDIQTTHGNYRIIKDEKILNKIPRFNISTSDACTEYEYYNNSDDRLISYFYFEDGKFTIPKLCIS